MKKLLVFTLAMMVLSACVPAALAAENLNVNLAEARQATARYHNLDAALADGFEPLFDCISHGDQGAMGFHYINPALVDDVLELTKPEVLMYEQRADGNLALVGVEYIMFESAWIGDEPPQFMGQTLQRKTSVGPYPVDPFFEVHAWVWKPNPAGMFADWNPNVACQ